MMAAGLGRLGLWLHLRHENPARPFPPLPAGEGPLLALSASQSSRSAATRIRAMLQKHRPGLRFLDLNAADMPDQETDRTAMRHLLERARPFAVLLLGSDLPPALVVSAGDLGLPVIMGEARFDGRETRWNLRAGMRRDLLASISRIFVTDTASHHIARHIGIAPTQVSMAGPVAEIHEPLPCNEAERAILAELLGGRHSWLAACIPPAEEEAVLAAHLAALRQSHRSLLFVVPSDPGRIDALTGRFEECGLIVARRDRDEEPTDEVQVMIADTNAELGLWYRLAPVTYIGGTLSGDDELTRHPFEPAALGSAVIHGPATGRFKTEWQQLDGGKAARLVPGAGTLAEVVAELTQPDLVAELASNAWSVSTGGAGVAMQITSAVLDLLEETGK
ncbi:3-deoxy-D-manno-octulosonic acid transferase [Paracoccus alkanivorans]|uniref:3-deoxy-D-manno-octulosonic acid transferase n=1 Tax=Paracoccus alkanivorans TaxID=2116655 RepID=A0A3M0M4V1_9RHOB|nr:glycosyltransferase N-terminal domain-containing protein [Paracoccus alkanivorans]RMC32461.1 3-deoxy-D-manno-octulosonic acid transferase [Paracoccus alkanivorans]